MNLEWKWNESGTENEDRKKMKIRLNGRERNVSRAAEISRKGQEIPKRDVSRLRVVLST